MGDASESSSLSPTSVTSTRASEQLSVDFHITDEAMSIGDEDDVQSQSLKHITSSLLSKFECLDQKVSKRWTKHIPKGIVQQARARFELKADEAAYTEEVLGFAAKGA